MSNHQKSNQNSMDTHGQQFQHNEGPSAAKRIMILGGGVMQLPAVRIARQKGWHVVVADGNPGAPARPLAHAFEEIDLRDWRSMIKAAKSWDKRGGIDGIFTAGTDFSATVARVAEALGLPGISVEAALNASDKSRMRRVLREGGIECPNYLIINSLKEWEENSGAMAFPLVVKPVDNMGARGVKRVETAMEMKDAVELALYYSPSGRVIAEEYIDGPEFSIDALVDNGNIIICGVADRDIRFPPYFVEMGHTMPTGADGPVLKAVLDMFKKGVQALGINSGAAKGDVKWSHNRAVIGEIAARLSGGYMSGWTYPYSSGIESTAGALNLAVGLPPDINEPAWERTSAERAFISIPGVIEAVSGEEEVRAINGVKELFILRSPGDEVTFPTNNVEKCGNIIAVHELSESAVTAAEKAIQGITLRLEAGNKTTEHFLFGGRHDWSPDAFRLFLPENRKALSGMPPYRVIRKQVPPDTISGNRPGAQNGPCRNEENIPIHTIYVAELPNLGLEGSRDWHCMTIKEAFDRVTAFTGCRILPADSPDIEASDDALVLGRLFWDPFLRGGVQAGIWIMDSVSDASGCVSMNVIQEWEKRWAAFKNFRHSC